MLTQGPAPDPKCKLNISSFLTLPHFSDCLICTWDAVFIILLLLMMGGWDRWGGGCFISGFGLGDRGWVLSVRFFFCVCFYL